ncbi:hypothetical protein OC842_001882 [Tilletia horrida]|uniref:NAD+ kinase n=1 Tax=Tilletia horrida TaxID=155126 RepID=A0AAN6GGZ3_9BASI|nr:hypothetical protein OC842_001882 [Tilletia horrida]
MSRNLTHQLAETAVGVREVSKQLGRARVQLDASVRSVLIITKARDNHLIRLTRELALWLMLNKRPGKQRGLVVYVDAQLRGSKRFDAQGIRAEYPHLFEPSEPAHPKNCMQSEDARRTPSADNIDMVREQRGEGEQNGATKVTGEDAREMVEEEDNDEAGQLRYWTSEMCSRFPQLFDLVVTLGGDGTVLFASWLFQRIVPPILPFSLGSLGFLTNFDFNHYQDVLQSALDRGIRVNLRMRFTATVYRAELPTTPSQSRCRRRAIRSGKTGEIMLREIREVGWDAIEGQDFSGSEGEGGAGPGTGACADDDLFEPDEDEIAAKVKRRHRLQCVDSDKGTQSQSGRGRSKKDKEVMCFTTRPAETFEILNDLVVDRGPSPYVSLLEVFGDEHHMTTVQADGLCISTPTGSTAYSLSAGGSLAHPEIPAILLTPICPHTLSFRPMLLPDSMELRIAVPYSSRSAAWASFDGRGRVELRQGDHIKVTASRYPFPTVCAEDQSIDWFQSISRTLKWNERQKQKSFVVLEDNEGDGARPKPRKNSASSTSGKAKRKESNAAERAAASGANVKPSGVSGNGDADPNASGQKTEATPAAAVGTSNSQKGGDAAQQVKPAKQSLRSDLPNGHASIPNDDQPYHHQAPGSPSQIAQDAQRATAAAAQLGSAKIKAADDARGGGVNAKEGDGGDDELDVDEEDDEEDDDDEEEDEEEEEEEEEEREEEYDITDSSAVVTRANSPLPRSRHGSSYSNLAGAGSESPCGASSSRTNNFADSWGSASAASIAAPGTASPSSSMSDRRRHASNPASLSEIASDLRRRSGGLSVAVGGSGSGSGSVSPSGGVVGALRGPSLSALRKLSPILRDTAAAGVRAAGGGGAGGAAGLQMQHHPGMVRRLTAAQNAEQEGAARSSGRAEGTVGGSGTASADVGGGSAAATSVSGGRSQDDGNADTTGAAASSGARSGAANVSSSSDGSNLLNAEGPGAGASGGGAGSSAESTTSQQSSAATSTDGRNNGGGSTQRANRQGAALVVYGDDSSDSDSLVGDE